MHVSTLNTMKHHKLISCGPPRCRYLNSVTRGQFLLMQLFQHYIATALATIRTAAGGVVVVHGMGEAQRLVMKLGPILGEVIAHRIHSEYLGRWDPSPPSVGRVVMSWLTPATNIDTSLIPHAGSGLSSSRQVRGAQTRHGEKYVCCWAAPSPRS